LYRDEPEWPDDEEGETEWEWAGDELDAEWDETGAAPSLPIILFSAAGGVAGGVLTLYVAYGRLALGPELSAGLATLGLLVSLGLSGAALSAATGSRAAPVNILFSCGVILLMLIFLGLCLLIGALAGTLLLRW
jgi:hypothetical protein